MCWCVLYKWVLVCLYMCVSNMTTYVRLCVCVFVYVFFLYECMCTCVCTYVYVTCECVYVWVCMYECACLWVCTRVCTYVCQYVFVCACVHVCMCIYLCVCMCLCVLVPAFVYVCICVCVCAYMCTCVLQLMPTLHLFPLNCSWRCDYHSFAPFYCCLSQISYWPSVQETCTNPRMCIFLTLYNFIKLLSPISSLGLVTRYCIKHFKLVLSHACHKTQYWVLWSTCMRVRKHRNECCGAQYV